MKKSRRHAYGQHFLKNPRILAKIVNCISPESHDTILEVGAGRGDLTALLAEKAARIIAIEKDPRLIPGLHQRQIPNLTLIQGDVLDMHFQDILPVPQAKVVGNLPYAISTAFLYKLLEEKQHMLEGRFMLQKEVAERVCAVSGSKRYGPLSILFSFDFAARIDFTLGPGAFSPPPKVDSALISLIPRPQNRFPLQYAASFRKFLHDVFLERRKILANNLKRMGIPEKRIIQALEACGIPSRARPEELTPQQFGDLFQFHTNLSP